MDTFNAIEEAHRMSHEELDYGDDTNLFGNITSSETADFELDHVILSSLNDAVDKHSESDNHMGIKPTMNTNSPSLSSSLPSERLTRSQKPSKRNKKRRASKSGDADVIYRQRRERNNFAVQKWRDKAKQRQLEREIQLKILIKENCVLKEEVKQSRQDLEVVKRQLRLALHGQRMQSQMN